MFLLYISHQESSTFDVFINNWVDKVTYPVEFSQPLSSDILELIKWAPVK